MKNMNCVSTMPEIMPEITDEAIIEALFAQRPYESASTVHLVKSLRGCRAKLNIDIRKMSAGFTELMPTHPVKLSGRSLLRL